MEDSPPLNPGSVHSESHDGVVNYPTQSCIVARTDRETVRSLLRSSHRDEVVDFDLTASLYQSSPK